MRHEKQRQQRILDEAGPLERLIWFVTGLVRVALGALPRRRIWRFVEFSRRPLVIGAELALALAFWGLGALHPGYFTAGGALGAALAISVWDHF